MIEGLHFDLPSKKVEDHLNTRAKYHEERAAWYQKQMDSLTMEEKADEDSSSISNSRKEDFMTKMHRHLLKVQKFQLMADHIVKNETYRLTEHDLSEIEMILSRY